MKKSKISAIKDKDLMQDTGGITKTRDYGKHERPPRVQQRDNFRERYLDKEQKKDLTADIDLSVNESGQVCVNDNSNNHNIVNKMSDLVNLPEGISNAYEVALEKSMNDDANYETIRLNDNDYNDMESFSFYDENVNDAIEMAEEQTEEDTTEENEEESNPFDGLFDDEDSQEETTEDTTEEQTTEDGSDEETSENTDEQETEQSNDSIDEYLNMEIDDSKLSEENKEKLDNFTSEQLDAFKKFLYENKVKKEEQ